MLERHRIGRCLNGLPDLKGGFSQSLGIIKAALLQQCPGEPCGRIGRDIRITPESSHRLCDYLPPADLGFHRTPLVDQVVTQRLHIPEVDPEIELRDKVGFLVRDILVATKVLNRPAVQYFSLLQLSRDRQKLCFSREELALYLVPCLDWPVRPIFRFFCPAFLCFR